MIINSYKNNKNTQFGASIFYDRQLIFHNLSKDKGLVAKDYSTILKLIERVDSFSKMKEDSVVELHSRVDKGQVNLICTVYDKAKKIFEPVKQRSVRRLSSDETYREKYLQNTKLLIKSVFTAGKEIDKISETVVNSKNIKGVIDDSVESEATIDNVKSLFEGYRFQSNLVQSLNRGYNPAERIVKLIKMIDEGAKGNTNLYLGIKGNRNPKTHHISTYFVLVSKRGEEIIEKKVLLSELFRKMPEDKLC